jgi:hypothetical protein
MMTYENDPVMKEQADAAYAVQAVTGFPARVELTVGAVESNWWKDLTGDFNYWGITAELSQIPDEAKFCPTHENLTPTQLLEFRADEQATAKLVMAIGSGVYRYSMCRWFTSFPNLDTAVMAFVDFFCNSPHRYQAAWEQYKTDHDEEALIKNICAAGYATGNAIAVELAVSQQANILDAVAKAKANYPGVLS